MQVRVVVSTLTLSTVVMLIVGFVLSSQMAQQLLDMKVRSATEELDRARALVETHIDSTDEGSSEQGRLSSARAMLTARAGAGAGESAVYTPVLIAPRSGPRGDIRVPDDVAIPEQLRNFVADNLVAFQYLTVSRDGAESKTLVIGAPLRSSIPGVELYLLFPLDTEEETLSAMQGIIAAGGAVLVLLLIAISWLVTRQVVRPVRSVSRTAERFAAGHLRERIPVRGEDEMARLAVSFNDMAEALSQQISQLEEFGNLQRRFTSDVSHELRTPLTTVRMAADLIHDQGEDLDPVARRASELMISELDRFEMLLGDLLEVSRHDAGMAELAAEKMDMRSSVTAALHTVEHLAEDAGSEIVVDMPDAPVMVEIDPRRVERILRNLLANAIDHGEGRPVRLTLRADAQAAAVTVRDFGTGLDPEHLHLVFNRFWRADPSRVRRSGGTGLGLAISQEDTKLHGGRLEVWGEKGKGACFRVTLPARTGGKLVSSPLPLVPPEVVEE